MLRQVFLNAAIVDAKELIRTSSHIDIVRLSLRTLLVHELVDGIVLRHCLYETIHDLEQCFAKRRRAAL